MNEEQESRHVCGFCKHYDSDNSYCLVRSEFEMYEEDTCDDWEGEED